jgi:hypothetical protein
MNLRKAGRDAARQMLLGITIVVGAIACLFGVIAMGALATANLLARAPQTEYHLRLRVNPDPAPTREELGEIADLSYEDQRLLIRWVRSFREAMGE